MDHHDEWFSSEDIEEQVEQHLYAQDAATTNTRLLQELQHLAEDDVRRLADIRARLVEYASGKVEREPVSLQQYQPLQLPHRTGPSRATKKSQFLVKVVSGLVATLIVGSMLLAFVRFGKPFEQRKLSHPTPVATVSIADLRGTSTFLMDVTSGKTLVDVKSHVRRPIASMATLMTAVVAIEDVDPNLYITVDQATLNGVPQGMRTAGLLAGDRLPLSDLLYGLLLPSGDDAALVIAQAVGGNTQKFVQIMNDEAHQLQLNDTHFSDPYSSSSNYSSAADLAKLANYAMQLFTFAQIVAAQEHVLAPTSQNHTYQWTNILRASYPGLNGIQTGYDARAGACIVFTVQKNSDFLIGVELNAQSEKILSTDVTHLLNQG